MKKPPVGQQTGYTPKVIKQIAEYLELTKDEDYEFQKTIGDKSSSYEEKVHVHLPSIEGFAKFLNVTRRTIYNWKADHPKFAEALDEISSEQKSRLINRGLEGRYSPVIVKLILSSDHGMKERSDMTTDDEPIKGNAITFVNFSDETSDETEG